VVSSRFVVGESRIGHCIAGQRADSLEPELLDFLPITILSQDSISLLICVSSRSCQRHERHRGL